MVIGQYLLTLRVNGWFALPYGFDDRALKRLTKHLGLLIIVVCVTRAIIICLPIVANGKLTVAQSNFVEQQSCVRDKVAQLRCVSDMGLSR